MLANYYRLIKAMTSKIVIDNWRERKKINDALPPEQRYDDVENLIEELHLPMFRSVAIGCIHEVTEAFLVSKCGFVQCRKLSRIII